MQNILLKYSIAFLLSVLAILPVSAQYDVRIVAEDMESDSLLLGYYYGTKQFVIDTMLREGNDFQCSSHSDTLQSGVHFLMDPRNRELAEFLVDKSQRFDIDLDFGREKQLSFKNSPLNTSFYDYIAFLHEKRAQRERLSSEAKSGHIDKEQLTQEINTIDREVLGKQESLLEEFPGTMLDVLLSLGMETKVPDFSESKHPKQKRFFYYKKHYFDKIKLSDDRWIRTPLTVNKIDRYLDDFSPAVPDSMVVEVDRIFNLINTGGDLYRFFSVHLLNKFAKMKIIGMDAVYVHIVDHYFSSEKTPWLAEEQLLKIKDKARKMKPTLIGKPAPDFTMYNEEGTPMTLSELNAKYTILLFWDPDCGHCKKEIPILEKFYQERRDLDVDIVAVCSKFMSKQSDCWEYVKDKEVMSQWKVLVDPKHSSRYKITYNITSYPQLFVLDEDKMIIYKQLGADQLPSLFEYLEGEKGS